MNDSSPVRWIFHESSTPSAKPCPKAGKNAGVARNAELATTSRCACKTRKKRGEAIRFLEPNPNAPFTNNEAETDLRMGKVRQKSIRLFPRREGAEIFCWAYALVTCTAASRWSVIRTLMKPSLQLIAQLALRMNI